VRFGERHDLTADVKGNTLYIHPHLKNHFSEPHKKISTMYRHHFKDTFMEILLVELDMITIVIFFVKS